MLGLFVNLKGKEEIRRERNGRGKKTTVKKTAVKKVASKKSTKNTVKKEQTEEVDDRTQICTCCGEEKPVKDFYNTNSRLYRNTGKMPTCKACIWEMYDDILKECQGDERIATFKMCQLMGTVFLEKYYESAVGQVQRSNTNSKIFRIYMQKVNSLKQVNEFSFEEGEVIDSEEIKGRKALKLAGDLTESDLANRETVINMLKYDPFEDANIADRKYLFNRIIDMLDDSILDDQMLLMGTISIVRGYNQVDKIDRQIDQLMTDTARLGINAGNIKALVGVKKDIIASNLKTAQDNGITANFNKKKGVGGGSISGIMKKLREQGFDEAKPNMFDIETSASMRQTADMSHQSILSQLNMDESEYSKLIAEQRELVIKLQRQADKAEEQLRRLKIYMRSEGLEYNNLPEIIETEFTEDELLTDKDKKILKQIEKLELGGKVELLTENNNQNQHEIEEGKESYIEEDIDF